jgi:N-ethylmaleimide reductase
MHRQFGITLDDETIPTFEYIVHRLNDYDLAYLHLSRPNRQASEAAQAVLDIARHFRPLYRGTLIINGGYNRQTGNQVIADGQADLVAFGVPYIANPDLAERFAAEAELNQPDVDTFYAPGPKGYVDYPVLAEVEVPQ